MKYMKDAEIQKKVGSLFAVLQNLQGKNRKILPGIPGGLIIFLLSFSLGVSCLYGASGPTVTFTGTIGLDSNTKSLQSPWDFCVVDNKLFMVSDHAAGNVKIYERDGGRLNLVRVLDRKGFGADDFSEPTYCFYNSTGKFGVLDFGKGEIAIYERIGRLEFKRRMNVPCRLLGTDIQLVGNKLLIAGYTGGAKGGSYELYDIDTANDRKTFLLPSHRKYGFESKKKFASEYSQKPDIRAIGRKGWFDVREDNVYFVWEGDIEGITRLDLKGNEISVFGKTSNQSPYIKPKATPGLIKARRTGDFKAIQREWNKVSYVKNLFTGSKYVMVIYKGPAIQKNKPNFWARFYTLNGDFISEESIPGKPGSIFYLDKETNKNTSTLYSLSEASGYYHILEYKISEDGCP